MKILGIDPGSATTGYGIIEETGGKTELLKFGLIETDKTDKDENRLSVIFDQMKTLIKENKPNVVTIERLFFFSNAKTVITVSQAQGVIKLAAAKTKTPIFEFTPLQIKKIISGNGWAKKNEVKKAVRKLVKVRQPKHKKTHFDNVVDAIACALCYVKSVGEAKEVRTSGRC